MTGRRLVRGEVIGSTRFQILLSGSRRRRRASRGGRGRGARSSPPSPHDPRRRFAVLLREKNRPSESNDPPLASLSALMVRSHAINKLLCMGIQVDVASFMYNAWNNITFASRSRRLVEVKRTSWRPLPRWRRRRWRRQAPVTMLVVSRPSATNVVAIDSVALSAEQQEQDHDHAALSGQALDVDGGQPRLRIDGRLYRCQQHGYSQRQCAGTRWGDDVHAGVGGRLAYAIVHHGALLVSNLQTWL